jgi:hypothetical protein
MRFGPRWLSLALTLVMGASAWAQPATQPAPDQAPVIGSPPPAAGTTPPVMPIESEEKPNPEDKGAVGVAVRMRFLFIPKAIFNLFVDHSTPMSQYSIGAAFVRRRGNFDIEFAVTYANTKPKNGYWLDKGNNPGVQGQYPGLRNFDDLSLIGADATFIWHTDIVPTVQFRYGAGIGIGFLIGNIVGTDTVCDANTQASDLDDPSTDQCHPVDGSTRNRDKIPVVPIVHLLAGLRFKLIDQLSLNVELGLWDAPFVGANIGYFF